MCGCDSGAGAALCQCSKITFASSDGGFVDCCRCACPNCRCNAHVPAAVQDATFEPNFAAAVGQDAAARLLRAPAAKHSLLARAQALALQVCSDGKLLLQLPAAIVGSLTVDDVLRVLGIGDSNSSSDDVAVDIAPATPKPANVGNAATTTTTLFDVEGMTCASCAATLESAIKQLPGVRGVQVNLLTHSATVQRDADAVTAQQIKEAIDDAGFEATERVQPPPGLESSTIIIGGMSCASCANSIEAVLRRTPGIVTASVNLLAASANVTYHRDKLGLRDVFKAIDDAGFEASLPDAGGASPLHARQQEEVRKWRRLLLWSMLFAIPAALISMILPPMHEDIRKALDTEIAPMLSVKMLVLFLLATPVQFWIGSRFYVGMYKSLKRGSANMDTLIAGGTSVAYGYSVASVILQMTLKDFKGDDYFETSALLIMFVVLGKYLEAVAKGKTSEALHQLLALQANTAVLVESASGLQPWLDPEASAREVDVALLRVGDTVKVLPGAKVPADGTVVRGASFVDESMITGESIPVEKSTGSTVIGATVNQLGTLFVRVDKLGADTMLSHIVKLVEEAQTSKAPIQAVADKISSIFVPSVLAIATVVFVIWISLAFTVLDASYLPNGTGPVLFALLFFITTVVIACPCALGLATPTAVMVGTGIAAKIGILIKGGAALEKAHRVTAILFDKTGTLTVGKPTVVLAKPLADGWDMHTFLQLLGRAESTSEHPLGRAIYTYAQTQIELTGGCDDYEAVPGRGLRCTVDGQRVLVGNAAWLRENNVSIPAEAMDDSDRLASEGKTVMLLARNVEFVGLIAVADVIRDESPALVAELKARGIHVAMVTGDNRLCAQAVARQVGVDEVFAEVLPADKAGKVQQLQAQGHVVAMVGDGINDSPALAQADVGIAMGGGTDIAMEAAQIVLLRSHLYDVLTSIDLSRKTFRRIIMNFVFAFGYNVVAIPVAAGVFYPLLRAMMPPWVAGLAMALSSVSVVVSSLMLRRYKPPVLPESAKSTAAVELTDLKPAAMMKQLEGELPRVSVV